MVTSIARQSVIIKCSMKKSVLTGNYEFYYAAGLLSKLAGVEIADDVSPEALKQILDEALPRIAPREEKEEYLCGLLADYHPREEYDEQMRELLLWGRREDRPWMM